MICCVCEWETHKQVTWHYENIEIILSCYFAPSLSCSRCSNPFCYLRSSRNSYICVEVWYSMHLMKNSRWNGNFLTVFFFLSSFRLFSSFALVLCSELRLIIPFSFMFFYSVFEPFPFHVVHFFSVVHFLCYFACAFKRLLLYSICWEPKKARKFRTHI